MRTIIDKMISMAVLLCIAMGASAQTDVSTLDNAVYFEPTTVEAGESLTMPLMLKNKIDVAAMTFDIVMPEGVEIEMNSRGTAYLVTFDESANRADASTHTLTSKPQADGSARILCYSASAEVFLGNTGAVLDFPVKVSADIKPGTYSIVIKNIELTTAQGSSVYPEDIVCTLVVRGDETPSPDYLKGDMDGNGKITINDVNILVNIYLGKK